MRIDKLILGLIPLLYAVLGGAAEHGFADLVLKNGKVITVDAQETITDAVAVQGNRIVAVGNVSSWEGPQTRIVDLKGRALLPGFIDAHSHVEGMANTEAHFVNIQVPPLKDANAIIEVLKRAQATRRMDHRAGNLQSSHADASTARCGISRQSRPPRLECARQTDQSQGSDGDGNDEGLP